MSSCHGVSLAWLIGSRLRFALVVADRLINYLLTQQCPGRFLDIIDPHPSLSKSNRLQVDIFWGFFFI